MDHVIVRKIVNGVKHLITKKINHGGQENHEKENNPALKNESASCNNTPYGKENRKPLSSKEGLCMKGNIYSSQNCPYCGLRSFVYDPKRSGLFCSGEVENKKKIEGPGVVRRTERHIEVRAARLFRVQFGKGIEKRFKTVIAAERFLTGLRFKADEGTLDPRDYRNNNPIGWMNLVDEYLASKECSKRHLDNIRNYLRNHLGKFFGQKNIKEILFSDFTKIFAKLELSDKSKSNARSAISDFFTWLTDHHYLKPEQLPKIPTVSFELGWRNIVDVPTQNNILEEIKKIIWDIDPKVYIAIKLLRTYIAMRPKDVLGLRVSDIDYADAIIMLKRPSKSKKSPNKPVQPKYVPLLDEDLQLLKSIPRGLPSSFIFVHPAGIKGATAGERYGQRLLWKKWKKACANLGIYDVDLYGGTKHSTATALSKKISPEQIQKGIMLESNQAFARYMIPDLSKAQMVYEQADALSKKAATSNVVNFKKDRA